VLRNFRIVDSEKDFTGSVIVENGIIKNIIEGDGDFPDAQIIADGADFPQSAVLMPAFVDLHAHFRDPGFPEKETLETASQAAAAGGFATVICMANTRPVIDTLEKAAVLKARSDSLGFTDLFPVISLSKNMEGLEISGIKNIPDGNKNGGIKFPLMLSEDGKDIADDALFLAAMEQAKRLKIPVSCHCDFGGPEAEDSKRAGCTRAQWSRIEENNAVKRVIEIGKKADCHIHIAHVSTGESIEIIRETKKHLSAESGFTVTCEATPHHIGACDEDARRMGEESYGRVNPPLRTEADRQALVNAVNDGTIDAIATDHAPHSETDKAAGAPGFSGLETAFAACLTNLAPAAGLRRLSELMSANPARILGLNDRGLIVRGLRADFVIVDTQAVCKTDPEKFKSKGKCSPFAGRELRGKVLMTFNAGKMVYNGG